MVDMTLEQLKCLSDWADIAYSVLATTELSPELKDDAEKRANLLNAALRDLAGNLSALHEELGGDL